MRTNKITKEGILADNEIFKIKLSGELVFVKKQIIERYQYLQEELVKLDYEGSFVEFLIGINGSILNNNEETSKLVKNFRVVDNNLEICDYLRGNIECTNEEIGSNLKVSDLDIFIIIAIDLFYLSLVNDDEVQKIMKSFKIGKLVTKYFKSHQIIMKKLDALANESKFILPYEIIFLHYLSHSCNFFQRQLFINFNIDFADIFEKLKRKARNGKLSQEILSLLEKYNEQTLKLPEPTEAFKLPFSKKGLFSDLRKINKFSHKTDFYNLYKFLEDLNEEMLATKRHVSDFKCIFYDLVKILIYDKHLLNDNLDSQLKYGKPGNRRFKIKRVESLFINLSDNYSTPT